MSTPRSSSASGQAPHHQHLTIGRAFLVLAFRRRSLSCLLIRPKLSGENETMSRVGGSPTTANSGEKSWPAKTLIGPWQTLAYTARLLRHELEQFPGASSVYMSSYIIKIWIGHGPQTWSPQPSTGSSTGQKPLAELCRQYNEVTDLVSLHSRFQRLQWPAPSSFLPISHGSNFSALQVTVTATSDGCR